MKNFNKDAFREDLVEQLNKKRSNAYIDFETTSWQTLDMHAPEKKKTIRANDKHFISKAIQKVIMKSSGLSSTYKKYQPNKINLYLKSKKLMQQSLQKGEKKYYEKMILQTTNILENYEAFFFCQTKQLFLKRFL